MHFFTILRSYRTKNRIIIHCLWRFRFLQTGVEAQYSDSNGGERQSQSRRSAEVDFSQLRSGNQERRHERCGRIRLSSGDPPTYGDHPRSRNIRYVHYVGWIHIGSFVLIMLPATEIASGRAWKINARSSVLINFKARYINKSFTTFFL